MKEKKKKNVACSHLITDVDVQISACRQDDRKGGTEECGEAGERPEN